MFRRGEQIGRWLRRAGRVGSAGLWLGLAVVYLVRPDGAAAVTVFPPWIWLVPGVGLVAGDLRRRGSRWGWAVVGAWGIYLLAMAEEPRSLARGVARTLPGSGGGREPGETLRVVSLNCAAGDRRAAEEVIAYRPDIVLLQESPGREAVADLGRRLFGAAAGVVQGADTALIVRGRITPAALSATERGYFVQARVVLDSGREVEVVSTRLLPAVFREDLWAPDCWREQAENRRRRREQLGRIVRGLPGGEVPVILGGDFNAPQGDAVFRLLGPRLRDAFGEAGLGWGNTIINEAPALRIDQVWAGEAFAARAVVARRTVHSDHRMVVCDLTWRDAVRPPSAPRTAP